jgi:hypothetical protein
LLNLTSCQIEYLCSDSDVRNIWRRLWESYEQGGKSGVNSEGRLGIDLLVYRPSALRIRIVFSLQSGGRYSSCGHDDAPSMVRMGVGYTRSGFPILQRDAFR